MTHDLTRRSLLAAVPMLALSCSRAAPAQNLLAGQDLAAGGEIVLPRGERLLEAPLRFAGQRLNLRGAGPNVTLLRFEPLRPAAAIELNTPGDGGQYQSSVTGLGFVSANRVDKTALHLVNAAEINLERIAIASGNWLGEGSIGIRTEGREFVRIRDCDIGCARPIVISPNPRFPTLSADFFLIEGCGLISTAVGGACIHMEDGVTFSNVAIRDTALVAGRDGFRYDDRTSRGASIQLEFQNVRTEQGTSPEGWSFDIRSHHQSVQDILFQNVRCDSARNGIRVVGGHRITLINTFVNQAGGRTALDIEFNQGTVLTILGSAGQVGGNVRLTNARKVTGVESQIGSPFGPVEVWVYDPETASRR
jgi:hypothetical protein